MPTPDQYLTTTQAAKLADVSPQAIVGRIKSGQLPAMRVGHAWLIKRDDLEKWKPLKPGPKNDGK